MSKYITALLEADRSPSVKSVGITGQLTGSRADILIADDVEEGDWTQEHKYQLANHIVRHIPTGRHFGLAQSRSGYYHSDWYYDATEIAEVHKVTETIVVDKWVVV